MMGEAPVLCGACVEPLGGRLPRARSAQLRYQHVGNETLVYDQRDGLMHCLNRAASAVWRCCDGVSDPAAIARRASARCGAWIDEALVDLALRKLIAADLLEPGEFARERDAAQPGSGPERRLKTTKGLMVPALATVSVESVTGPSRGSSRLSRRAICPQDRGKEKRTSTCKLN